MSDNSPYNRHHRVHQDMMGGQGRHQQHAPQQRHENPMNAQQYNRHHRVHQDMMGDSNNARYYEGGAADYLTDDRPSGNAYRDQWLAERSESELRRLEALAASEGLKLQPATILRPILIAEQLTDFKGGDATSISFYFPFYAYVRKVTSTVRFLKFKQNQEPDDSVLAPLDPREYVTGKIIRSSGEQLFNREITLDQWSGNGEWEYVFDLIPFVTRAETLSIQLTCNERIENIDLVQITLHCMRFPVEGV